MIHNKSIFKIFVKTLDVAPYAPWVTDYYDSSGTGFCVAHNKKKYIVTNYHVVENAIVIKVFDYAVDIIALDMFTDLALLTCPDYAEPLEFGTVETGDLIDIQGYPLHERGLNFVSGSISKLTKIYNLRDKRLMFMSDCLTDHGNSGSPALCDNKVIGVLNSGMGKSVNYSVIIPFFAVQDFIKKAVLLEKEKLIKTRHVYQRYCKFSWQVINDVMREVFKLKNNNGILCEGEICTHIQGIPILADGQIRYEDFLKLLGYKGVKSSELISFHYLFNFLEGEIEMESAKNVISADIKYYVPDTVINYKIFGDMVFVRGNLLLAERVEQYVPQDFPYLVYAKNLPKFERKVVDMPWEKFCETLDKAKENQILVFNLVQDNWKLYIKANPEDSKKTAEKLGLCKLQI